MSMKYKYITSMSNGCFYFIGQQPGPKDLEDLQKVFQFK